MEELRHALASSVHQLDDAPMAIEHGLPQLDSAGPEIAWSDPPAKEAHRPAPRAPAPPPLAGRVMAGAGGGGLAAWVMAAELHAPGAGTAAAAAVSAVVIASLPRVGWLAVTVAACAALAIRGSPGIALFVVVGPLVPVLLLPTKPGRWPLAVVAPALGLVGLAAAWPALAARAPSAWQRAALGAAGWIWLQLAAILGNAALYTALPEAVPPPAAWGSSSGAAAREALAPLVSSGALVPALAWGLAALALPAVLRQPDPLLRAGAVALWSALLLGATLMLLSMGSGQAAIGARNALLGVAGGMAAALLGGGILKPLGAAGSPDVGSRLA